MRKILYFISSVTNHKNVLAYISTPRMPNHSINRSYISFIKINKIKLTYWLIAIPVKIHSLCET